jgi:hypothetical protein
MLCKPATFICLVSIAGVIYHLFAGHAMVSVWWAILGIFGVGTFQVLCMFNMEHAAWFLMVIPVMVVCFFLAIAVLASSMRIKNVEMVPCKCRKRPCNRCRSDLEKSCM